jgi:NAD(P)-dependent dehydrogenase (short-subunit alcohol dehydrogenase family)
MSVELSLENQVAVVTGAGRGIGRAAALELSRAGAAVVVTDRDDETARDAAAEIDASGGTAWALRVDVARPQDCASLYEFTRECAGRADVLFHSAGVQFQTTHVEDTSDEEWRKFIDVNLNGTFYVCRALIPLIRSSGGGGSITLMASGRVENGWAGSAAYAASKGGVASFARSLAWEVGHFGINVNSIVPGITDTDGARDFQRNVLQIEPAQAAAEFAAGDPMGKVSTPQDIASAVLYLATSGRWITGQMHTLRVYAS